MKTIEEMTSEIVVAKINAGGVETDEIPKLVEKVAASLRAIGQVDLNGIVLTHHCVKDDSNDDDKTVDLAFAINERGGLERRVKNWRATITDDYLISQFDGKQYKTLTRHLSSRGHSPDSYRKAFGLPDDYPMIAPNYAKERARIAEKTGLVKR